MFITSYAQVKNKMKRACYDPTIICQKNSSLNLFRANQHKLLLDAVYGIIHSIKRTSQDLGILKKVTVIFYAIIGNLTSEHIKPELGH
jgi:hypothetical protein